MVLFMQVLRTEVRNVVQEIKVSIPHEGHRYDSNLTVNNP